MAGPADQKVTLTLSGKDEVTPAANSASASLKGFGGAAEEAKGKAKGFGETLSDLRPKGEAISAVFGTMAAGAAAVAGVFAKAAGASEELGGQLSAVGGAANDSFKALGDAISRSQAWNTAVSNMISTLGEITTWITENDRVINQTMKPALVGLADAASGATLMVAGLAESLILLTNTVRPYVRGLLGANPAWQMGKGAIESESGTWNTIKGALGGVANMPGEIWAGLTGIVDGIGKSENAIIAVDTLAERVRFLLERLASRVEASGQEWTFPALDLGTDRKIGGRRGAAPKSPYSYRGAEPDMGDVWANRDKMMGYTFAGPEPDMGAVWQGADEMGPIIDDSLRADRAAEIEMHGQLAAAGAQAAMALAQVAISGGSAAQAMAAAVVAISGSAAGALEQMGPYGQAAGLGVRLVGLLAGKAIEESGRSNKRREFTVQNPLPVRVVNKEELQSVVVYNLTVAGGTSGALQSIRQGRAMARDLNMASRVGAARLNPRPA